MNPLQFTIPGKPIAKRRPRFFRKGKFVGTYNEQVTEEGAWLLEAKRQIGDHNLFTGPICLKLEFVMSIPKSTSKKELKKLASNPYHIKKPDLDNLIKFVKDCLNQFVWQDDSQVCLIQASKYYGKAARTEIEIEERVEENEQ